MSISEWPEQERPREKLLSRGAKSLSDAELLAIFLRSGIPGKTAVDLARELIGEFGSIRNLLQADLKQFSRSPGLGPAKYAQLQAILELSSRCTEEVLSQSDVISSPEAVKRLLQERLGSEKQEVFHVLFLSNRHQIIRSENLFYGTINSSAVYPREIVRKALEYNAAALILAHNHPSGVAEPSQSDIQITRRIQEAAANVDIRLLDHIVIGCGQCISLAERGVI